MNHLENFLFYGCPLDGLAPRAEFYQLRPDLQEKAHAVATELLVAWYDVFIKAQAKNFLAELPPPAEYNENVARQRFDKMMLATITYNVTSRKILLCSQHADDYTEDGTEFSFGSAAQKALSTDVDEYLGRVCSFNWQTGEHEEVKT